LRNSDETKTSRSINARVSAQPCAPRRELYRTARLASFKTRLSEPADEHAGRDRIPHHGARLAIGRVQDRSHSPARQAKTKTRARVLAAGARADFPAAARCNINEDTNMSTDLTTTDDGWLDAAAEANARVLRGSLLRFNDWNWSKNKEGEPVEKGTKLVALGTAAAWARWAGGKPVEYRMRQSGKPLPDREELGNTDQSQWEMGPDGKTPRDPWQSTRLVYLVDPDTAEAFTFSTSSWGGREAVINLGDAIARMRSAHPKALPVVSLEATAMHTRYGRKSKPVFKIVDWKAAGEGVWEEQKQLPSQEPDELPY